MNPLIQLKESTPLLLIPLLTCFASIQIPKAFGAELDILPNGNTAYGSGVLVNLTYGVWNSGFGFQALNHNTIGSINTATGLRALFNNVGGDANTATGTRALFSNTDGNHNTANGYQALFFNTTGERNTAVGFGALYHNTTSAGNTATGYQALYSNTFGFYNNATGAYSLTNNTIGNGNTANGYSALRSNTTGNLNTANGYQALENNTAGNYNTANGVAALLNNTTGAFNTALGYNAGSNITGSGNVCIGASVFGVAGESDTTRIRNINTTLQTFVGGTNNYVTVRMSDGRLGFTAVVSSRRYKEDIKPMDKASEALLALKPVTFRLKGELDPSHRPQWGLIAEEVERVNPDLVDRNNKGEVESVRYDAVNAMLLNEFLKEHKTVQEQGATIARLEKQIEALTAGLQKVSAQLEASKPAPQVVNNP